MSNQPNEAREQASEPTQVTDAPTLRPDFLIGAIILAIVFFLTPYLFGSSAPELPGQTAVTGAKLVGDGVKLVTQHETLVGVQNGTVNLSETLTAPWWGQISPEQKLWRPLPLFMLGVAGAMNGVVYDLANPGAAGFPFHLLVLAFHVFATMLLFFLAYEFTKSNKAALITAALFATLPVHGEAIFDIAGIAELMAAAFGFGAWTLWLKAGPTPLKNMPMLLGSIGLVALAALSKESAFMLPVLFFLVDAGRNPDKSGLDFGFALKKLPALGAIVVVLAVLLGIRISLLGGLAPDFGVIHQVDNPLLGVGVMDRMANGLRMMLVSIPIMLGINPLRGEAGFNVGDLFGFSADYSFGQVQALSAFSLANILALLVLLGTIGAAFVMAKKCGVRAGLWLALLASLLLSSNFLFPIGTIFAERLLYFPSGILLLMVGMFLARRANVGLIAGIALAVGGGAWTYARAEAWSTEPNYFAEIQKDAPGSAKAAFYAGLEFEASQLFGTAATKYKRAIEIFPNYYTAEILLGRALEQDLKYDDAITHYARAFEIQIAESDSKYEPDTIDNLYGPSGLLVTLTNLRVYNKAVDDVQGNLDYLDGLIAKGYDSPMLRTMRARTLLNLARVPEAEQDYKASLAIEPTGLAVRYYGELLRKLGRNEEALAMYDTHSKATDAFNGTELVEFLLQRADAELLTDPIKAIATIEEAKNRDTAMSAEQIFRTRWLWVQATLDTMPTDPAEQEVKYLEMLNELKRALTIYNVANETTYAARYVMANIMFNSKDYAGLIPLAEDMLQFRSTPILRTYLAEAYTKTDEPEKAVENLSIACKELLGEDGPPIDLQQLLSTRRSYLRALTLADRRDTILDVIAEWHALGGGEDMWTLALASDWAAGWDEIAGAATLAEHLATTFPSFAEGVTSAKRLASYAAPDADYSANFGLASHRYTWGNLPGTIEATERALTKATSDMEKAEAYNLLAISLAQIGRLDEAIMRLDEALALTLPPDFQATIERTRAQMAAK